MNVNVRRSHWDCRRGLCKHNFKVVFPDLTKERRLELIKLASKYAEQSRISVRNLRRDSINFLKRNEKQNFISKDKQYTLNSDIQKITNVFIKNIDELLDNKKKGIMQV